MARSNSNNTKVEKGLPVLGEDDDDLLDLSNSAYKRNPPLSNRSSSQQSRRTPTPTKQISLTAVRRKEDSFYQEDDPSIINELKQSMKLEAERSFIKEPSEYVVERNTTSNHVTKTKKPPRHNCLHNGDVETTVVADARPQPGPRNPEGLPDQGATAKPPEKTVKKEESSSSEDSSDEEEERKAPNQLIMEFLECIYAKDYPMAAKLCKMILIYEPDHPVALQFQPVIAEKIQLDIEAEQEGSDDDDEGDSGEEDDSEDDSDDDDSDDSDSDESSEEEEDENEDNQNTDSSNVEETGDSGIASTESSDRDFYEM